MPCDSALETLLFGFNPGGKLLCVLRTVIVAEVEVAPNHNEQLSPGLLKLFHLGLP